MAKTNSTWTKVPMVYVPTIPSNQPINRMTAMVYSIAISPCFTDDFVKAFFGASAVFTCDGATNSTDCKFNFNYTASHHQDLLFRHWQDKGKGAGTLLQEEFKGDIADA